MPKGKTHYGSVGADGKPALLSRAVRSGDLIYTAGAVAPRDQATGRPPAGIEAQAEGVLRQLEGVLKEAGASLQDVMKATVFLVNMSDYPKMNEVYRRFFPKDAPARTTVQVAGLASSDYLVEIEMLARASGA